MDMLGFNQVLAISELTRTLLDDPSFQHLHSRLSLCGDGLALVQSFIKVLCMMLADLIGDTD